MSNIHVLSDDEYDVLVTRAMEYIFVAVGTTVNRDRDEPERWRCVW